MSGKTKLYQRTGSPLIQGNSKRDTSSGSVWFKGVLVGLAISLVVAALFLLYVEPFPGTTVADSFLPAAVAVAVVGLPGLLLGSWLGTAVARGMGWRHQAAVAGVTGAVLALPAVYVVTFVAGWTLMTV